MIKARGKPIQPPAIQPRPRADGGSGDDGNRALAELYQRHGGAVYSLARELCGAAAAEEVTAEVFLALRDSASPGARDASALLAQAHARIAARLRAACQQRAPVASSAAGVERVLHRSTDPARADLLSGLVPTERQAISLAYFAARTYHEVAAVLHLSDAGARSTIRAGLGHLRHQLVAAGLVPARLGEPGADQGAASDMAARFSELAVPWMAGHVEAVVARVVDLAMLTVEGCDLADVLHVDLDIPEGRPARAGGLAAGCAALQHQLGEGPGLDALGGHRIVYAADLSTGDLWPRFSPAAAARGIRSILALPLGTEGADGVLELCSRSPRAFGVTHRARGVLLASVVGLAMTAARHGDQALLAEGNHTAPRSRQAITHAQAIMMEREAITAAQAFDVVDRATSELDAQLREIMREASANSDAEEGLAPGPST